MIEVDQTILHDPANGKHGNCFSAVLAGLLHIPIDQVPVFSDTVTWRRHLNAWLRPHGLAFLNIRADGARQVFEAQGIEDCHHEVSGPSPRSADTLHSCIGRDCDLVFDPHPHRTGLADIEEIGVFIVLRPWDLIPQRSTAVSGDSDTYPRPARGWVCFHCGERFSASNEGERLAREHFGETITADPACRIDIAEYRRMEAVNARHCHEDTELHREIARLQADHATALQRAEEAGYAKGLADGAKR